METLVELIFAVNGFIFGGYVRDMITGSTPNDIDCCIRPQRMADLWRLILGRFPSFTVVKMRQYGDYYDAEDFCRILVNDEGCAIKMDITSNPLFAPDFDINMLRLTNSGIGVISKCPSGNVEITIASVLQHINQNIAMELPTCSAHRKERMIVKGWKII